MRTETDFGGTVTHSSDVLFKCQKSILVHSGLRGNFNADPEDDVMAAGSDISKSRTCWQTNSDHVCVDFPLKTSFCH